MSKRRVKMLMIEVTGESAASACEALADAFGFARAHIESGVSADALRTHVKGATARVRVDVEPNKRIRKRAGRARSEESDNG